MPITKLGKAVIDAKKIHGHDKVKAKSVAWYFHNNASHGPGGHDDTQGNYGYQHCEGSESNNYKVKHLGKDHVITKQYARGHGVNTEPTWFKFTAKLKGGWDLASGEVIPVADVPDSFK